MPANKLLTSLVRAPSPTRWLMRNTWLDSVLSKFSCAANTASSHATIKLMVPCAARNGPPDMGASMVCTWQAINCAAVFSTSSGDKVGHSMTVWCACNALSKPCDASVVPDNTSCTSCAFTTHTMRVCTCCAKACGVVCTVAPNICSAVVLCASMSHTCTAQPCDNKRLAMPPPILPTPMMPTLWGMAGEVMTAPIVWLWPPTSRCPNPSRG